MNKKFLLLLLLPLFFLPQILSTSLGKPLFTQAIEKKTDSNVDIGSLSLSWLGPQKFKDLHFTRGDIKGAIEELSIEAPFWSFSGPFQLKNGTANGKIEKINGKVADHELDLTGEIQEGSLSVKGTFYSKKRFDLLIDAQKLPPELLEAQLPAIVGASIDLKGRLSDSQIDLKVSSPNFQTQIRGHLTPDAITLKEPLIASLKLTPEASALLLKEANPLFLTAIYGKTPITLRIEPKGFSFPIPYSLDKLQIGEATLDLGQVRCRNGKSLASLISLLKNSRLSSAKEMNGWFTPVVFRLEQGLLEAGRMDILLADEIHICTWGKIDLIKDRLDMILGIPADTLESSFGIRNLSKSYVLKVELRGTTRDPEIMKGPAAAKIAALIAANQVPQKGILGGIAELFSNPKEEKGVPPPQRPFPWEK